MFYASYVEDMITHSLNKYRLSSFHCVIHYLTFE